MTKLTETIIINQKTTKVRKEIRKMQTQLLIGIIQFELPKGTYNIFIS